MMMRVLIAILITIGTSGRSVRASECKTDEDCQVDGAVCTNGQCACPPEYVANSIYTSCLPVAHGYGASCSDNLQCSASLMSGGFCNQGHCDCEPGYHYFLGNCWKTSGLFEKCYTDENCFVDQDFESSVCSEKKICVCKEGYYQREYSSCRLASYKPGDPCGISVDCKFDHATCLWNHTCSIATADQDQQEPVDSETNGGNVQRMSNAVIEFSKIGGTCKTTSDCPKYSSCLSSGVCLCLPGYYTLDNVTCNAEIGGNCTADSNCIGRNSYCKNEQFCDCMEGHVISVDRRYCDKLSRQLGWSCLRDGWCAYFGPNALCIEKKCACSNSSHYVADQMYCWITKKAGESCENELDCGISRMSCDGGICRCQNGTHPSTSKDVCRADSHSFGQDCVETIDCMYPNSACNTTTGKCVCASHHVLSGSACVSGIGGPCNETNSCSLQNSQCVNHTCACAKQFVPDNSGSVCLPQQTVMGAPCQDTNQCNLFDGVCDQGKCSCSSGSHYVEGWKCYKDVELGGTCARNGECVALHSSCLKNVCSCDHGYRSDGVLCSGTFGNSSPLSASFILMIASTIYSYS
uniref:Tenascin-X n=2 Tax=Lygus hesperus TaxID=30085 RepID=A0A0A9W1V9_LYGHE